MSVEPGQIRTSKVGLQAERVKVVKVWTNPGVDPASRKKWVQLTKKNWSQSMFCCIGPI